MYINYCALLTSVKIKSFYIRNYVFELVYKYVIQLMYLIKHTSAVVKVAIFYCRFIAGRYNLFVNDFIL